MNDFKAVEMCLIGCGFLGLFTCFVLWFFEAKPWKRKGIYWNEAEQQIMTKSGECLYDKNEYVQLINLVESYKNGLNEDICVSHNLTAKLQAQLQCGAKGHGKWEYQGTEKAIWMSTETWCGIQVNGRFIFKCPTCNLEKTLTWKELTAKQRDGLKALGIGE